MKSENENIFSHAKREKNLHFFLSLKETLVLSQR